MNCPGCGAEILPGDDVCGICLSPTSDIGLPSVGENPQKKVMNEKITCLSFQKPILLNPKDSIFSALEIMQKDHFGCVVLEEKKQLKGIFTERDVLQKLAGTKINLKKEILENYMTPNPEMLTPAHTLAYALNKMSIGGFRHLPVVDNQKVIGLISVRDILKYFWG